jgi:hypothetical protein
MTKLLWCWYGSIRHISIASCMKKRFNVDDKLFRDAKVACGTPEAVRPSVWTTVLWSLLMCLGCARQNVHVPNARDIPVSDNSYTDLEGGSRLSILVPLTKSGGTRPTLSAQQHDGSAITLSAADLTGYELAYYSITGKRNGPVRLKFTSAEITKDGKTAREPNPPILPFQLPRGNERIRLIYLVRASQADHNMAIVASKHLNALNTFTKQLKNDPGICARHDDVFCSWVPAGVAVKQELASNE